MVWVLPYYHYLRRGEGSKAKGLEYRAAVVMACDNGVIPSPDRLAEADLVAWLEEIYDTERNLLYVACTRARDYLLITCGGTPSELLLDMEELVDRSDRDRI